MWKLLAVNILIKRSKKKTRTIKLNYKEAKFYKELNTLSLHEQ